MRKTALLLKRDDTVCGVDDDKPAFDSIQLIEGDGRETERIQVDKSNPLGETLKSRGVTDIIADHYQPQSLNQLRENGFTLWISPPQARRKDAEQAWRDGSLSQAMIPGDVSRSSRPEMPRSDEFQNLSGSDIRQDQNETGQRPTPGYDKGSQASQGRIGAEEESE